MGSEMCIRDSASGSILMCLAPSHDDFEVGDIIGLEIDADHLVCFDQQIN